MPVRKKQSLIKTGAIALGITATLLLLIDHQDHLDGYDYALVGLIILAFLFLLISPRYNLS